MPPALRSLLDSAPETSGLIVSSAIPERLTFFADGARGPRHHDLVLYGNADGRKTVVGIEAKADEGLDQPIERRVRKALRDRPAGKATSFPERLDRFSVGLFGFPAFPEQEILDPRLECLPYQLVSGLAGTIREAAVLKADQAVFAVHVLQSGALDPALVQKNARGFEALCELMVGGGKRVRDGHLVGPVRFPGSRELPKVPLFIGSATSS